MDDLDALDILLLYGVETMLICFLVLRIVQHDLPLGAFLWVNWPVWAAIVLHTIVLELVWYRRRRRHR